MSLRTRLLLTLGITMAVVGFAGGFAASRMQKWHAKGWTGVYYSPKMPGVTGEARYGNAPGEVVITYPRSPAHGKLLARDRIVSVDGIPIDQVPRLRELDERSRRGDRLVYRVQREGRQIDVPLVLSSPLRTPWLVAKIVVGLVVATTFIVVALVVFVRKPDDLRATVFYAFALVCAVAIFASATSGYESAGGAGIVPSFGLNTVTPILAVVFSIAYAPLILHLSLIFPRERPILVRRPYLVRWIYSGAVLAALLIVSIGLLLVGMFRDPAAIAEAERSIGMGIRRAYLWLTVAGLLAALQAIWAGRREGLLRALAHRPFRSVLALFALLLAVTTFLSRFELKKVAFLAGAATILLPLLVIATYPVFACVALVRSYRSAGVEEKRQVQWPLWGMLIALVTKILCTVVSFGGGMLITLLHGSMIAWLTLFQLLSILPTVASLAIPLAFAAAILKYRLMNIDVIIRKTVAWTLLSGAIVFVYLVLVGGLGTLLVRMAGLKNQTMVIASTLVVAALFVPLRSKLQELVDRNLFRHRYDYPEALRAITGESRSASAIPDFLGSAAEKVQQALQNRAVLVFTERQDDYVATAKVGVSDTLLGSLRVSGDIAPFLDRPFDPRRRTLPPVVAEPLARVETTLVVPVASRAFMALAPKLTGGEFDVEDIDFLRSAAGEIGAGIDRIRMQAEEADFAQAGAIQLSLLPREMPQIAGLDLSGVWQPARTMGGDYYDLIKLGDQELAVCIGDVAGKGMPAALVMSGLQAAVRASASGSPADVCERVRRVVVSSLSGGRFATFFYATIDTGSMQLRWCNAGHNAPIVSRADGTILRLAEGGPAFTRLFRDQTYAESGIDLLPGDRIVLFTDGVTEAADASGDIFGEERLERLVADSRSLDAASTQQTIVDATLAFAEGEPEDDLTLVVAAVRG